MSREVKFRAFIRAGEWEEDVQKYVMVYDLAYEDYEPINDLLANTENLMQFTGLHDRNGKEIWESDILFVPDVWHEAILEDGSGPDEPTNHLAEVAFDKGSFGVKITIPAEYFKKGFNTFPWIEYEMGGGFIEKECEVIGNIYENPELLKDSTGG